MAVRIFCLLGILWLLGFLYGVAFTFLGKVTEVFDVPWWMVLVYPAQAITIFLGGIVGGISIVVLYFARRI